MREMKYKAWEEEANKMFDWEEILEYQPSLETFFNNKYFIKRPYVGLKDCNGVEVYEGDILRFKAKEGYRYIGNIGILRWSYMAYVLETSTGEHLFIYADEFEVIGNIYENKDLLAEMNSELITQGNM